MNGRLTVLILVATLASCGGGSSVAPVPTAAPSATPGAPALAYPRSGSVEVPTTVGIILIEDFGSAPASSFSVEAGGAPVAFSVSAVPSPLPSGVQPSTAYLALAVANLAPATTYSIIYEPCAQSAFPQCELEESLGSFTTQ